MKRTWKAAGEKEGLEGLTSGAGGGGAGDVGRGRMVGAEARGRWTGLWGGGGEMIGAAAKHNIARHSYLAT